MRVQNAKGCYKDRLTATEALGKEKGESGKKPSRGGSQDLEELRHLKEGDEDKLQWLIASIGHSKATSFRKSTYASWIQYFEQGKGS